MTSDFAPRLLIAEDDAELRETLQLVLSDEGYQVTTASSLAEALALTNEQAFDFVLTDLFRVSSDPPLQSALPLLKEAAPTPVGILTAWPLSEEEALQAGFAFLIEKPFDLDELMSTLAAGFNTALTQSKTSRPTLSESISQR